MWLLPTHGRVERALAFLEACVATHVSTPGLVVINGPRESYPETFPLPENWQVVSTGENLGFLQALNWAFAAHPSEPWYGLLNDDFIPETDRWDTELVGSLPKNGIVTSNDGWQADRRMAGAWVVDGELLRAVGYWAPADMWHCFCDDMWEDIGRTFQLWDKRLDVMVRHHHVFRDVNQRDETYHTAYSRFDADRKVYERWQGEERGAVFARIAALRGARQREVDISGLSIAIGTPCYGGALDERYVRSLCYTIPKFLQYQVPFFTITVPDESMVQRARNSIAWSFLHETEASHLLFIDADMGWNPDDVLRLLAHKHDIVGGAGPRKAADVSFCFRPIPEGTVDAETGCLEVETIGTGFLLISRACIEALIKAHPEIAFRHQDGATHHALFQPGIKGQDYWSEDYMFCLMAREAGYRIWMDPTVELEHVGRRVWQGSVAKSKVVRIHHNPPDAQPELSAEAAALDHETAVEQIEATASAEPVEEALVERAEVA